MHQTLLVALLLVTSCAQSSYARAPSRASGLAMAPEPAPAPPPSPPTGPPQTPAERANRGAILVYTAHLVMAVFDVAKTQASVVALAQTLGGFMSAQATTQLTIRVPSARFDEAVQALEKLGDVTQRDLSAEDVTREYLDLELRIKNARAVRERLEALLVKATKVEETLAIEKELARVTQDIESMEGSLRFLKDRVALSTLTVSFVAREREHVGRPFQLPFPWLQDLGLGSLLRFNGEMP